MRDQPAKQPLSAILLEWYDNNARRFPWRVPPGDRGAGKPPDPYAVWLSEVMLQQTTTAAVRDYFIRFTQRWPDIHALANAKDSDVMAAWAGLGYYARARNLLKCARMVSRELEGKFPDSHEALLRLPGVGPYTAAAIAAIAFDRKETVVDGNVERVMARLNDVTTPLPAAKPELKALAARLTPAKRPGDYAQAVMDLGATICTPKTPHCGVCPWRGACQARVKGKAADLPYRQAKTPKPRRRGLIYLARRKDGAWLLERRPDKGLLGGMLGWPGSAWGENPRPAPPCQAEWLPVPAEVRHTFTHFHLRLAVHVAEVDMGTMADCGFFLSGQDFRPGDLPTVMRKAHDIACSVLDVD